MKPMQSQVNTASIASRNQRPAVLWHFYTAIVSREIRKMLKQRDRLGAAMVRPVLWLWIIGGGMQALAGPDYTARLMPGIVGMTLLFGGMVGGLSIAFDKDAGTMRLLVTSPFASAHVLVAKAIAAGLGALIQVSLLGLLLVSIELIGVLLGAVGIEPSLVFPWLGQHTTPNWALFVPALLIGALSCGILGVLCGAFVKSIDGFAVMMNFVIFPLFFFSGALYPLEPMPALAKAIALVNPFSYTVDLLRHAFSSHAELPMTGSVVFLAVSGVVMIALSTWQFNRSGTSIPLQQ